MKILYGSEMIRAAIVDLFGKATKFDRRVVLVAYIGKDHAKFLLNPAGIQIVCNPTPGATSPIAVSELQQLGADIYFSDKLHMKVYWSQKKGCVITSANLSQNALGVRGLKEAGVFLAVYLRDRAGECKGSTKKGTGERRYPGECLVCRRIGKGAKSSGGDES